MELANNNLIKDNLSNISGVSVNIPPPPPSNPVFTGSTLGGGGSSRSLPRPTNTVFGGANYINPYLSNQVPIYVAPPPILTTTAAPTTTGNTGGGSGGGGSDSPASTDSASKTEIQKGEAFLSTTKGKVIGGFGLLAAIGLIIYAVKK